MPLLKGSDKGIVGENIRTLMREGKKQSQAVAIAANVAGLGRKKKRKARFQHETTLEQGGQEVRGKGQNRIEG